MRALAGVSFAVTGELVSLHTRDRQGYVWIQGNAMGLPGFVIKS